ncbi:MAG TPA: redoxin domain-containing protein [Cyclobacteriaceae bacterium]|nr:redoxin domain-containing protein [Cyclobacteriaceae bacterium]
MSVRPGVLLLLLIALLSTASFAQSGYKLDFKVKGLKDTTVYLAYYLMDQTYLRDTAKVNSQGVFSFENTKPLAQGVFMVAANNTTLFQFLIGNNQRFSMETDVSDFTGKMVVTGDEDNKLFFENANFLAKKFKDADPYVKIIRDSTLKEDAKKEAREEFKKHSTEVIAYQDNLIAKHPTTLTARLIKTTREIEVPEAPKRADGTIDSTWQFKYYKAHYFDNFDISDDALLRIGKPMFKKKLTDYLDRLFLQQPDTLTKEIMRLATKVKKNQETYKYFMWTLMSHYQSHQIMGLDEVYVNLYDKFVATGEADYWLDPASKKGIKEYVEKIRVSLVGKNAGNLIMQDKDLKAKSMYDIKNKYTILFFFSPDCGHCKEETPKLVDFYNKNKAKFDIEVYAVSIDTSMLKMRNFIKDYKMPWITVNGPRTYVGHHSKMYYAETTPTMYVIDAKHKIIAKKLPIEQLPEFFQKYESLHPAPKPNAAKPNGNKGTLR